MEKCTLCDWENSKTKETLVDWLDRKKIMDIDLCNNHYADLNPEQE